MQYSLQDVLQTNKYLAQILNQKCDYYIDNIERLYTEPFDNITATGIVCDSKNNKSYIPIKNGLAHGKAENIC